MPGFSRAPRSASDDGTIESVQWTQLQGPNVATLSDDGTEELTASGLTSGTYVFQLKATDDDGNMGTDTATVVVAHQTGAGTLTGVATAVPTAVPTVVATVGSTVVAAGAADGSGAPVFSRIQPITGVELRPGLS